MTFEVTIISRSDGEKAVISEPGDWDEGAEFRWTEGNEACDCNRRGLFLAARGDPNPDFAPCGDTAFEVILPNNG